MRDSFQGSSMDAVSLAAAWLEEHPGGSFRMRHGDRRTLEMLRAVAPFHVRWRPTLPGSWVVRQAELQAVDFPERLPSTFYRSAFHSERRSFDWAADPFLASEHRKSRTRGDVIWLTRHVPPLQVLGVITTHVAGSDQVNTGYILNPTDLVVRRAEMSDYLATMRDRGMFDGLSMTQLTSIGAL